MPRPHTILQSQFPYHIYARCINRQWFDIPTAEVWEIVSDYLYLLHHGFNFVIHSFLLMDNHLHGLVSTPEENLGKGMNHFQREVSRRISERSGRINQTFGGPYKWCIVDTYNYYLNAYKYIYRNPVEAGLVVRCQDYKFSTLNGLIGQQKLVAPVTEDTILFDPNFRPDTIAWLNKGKRDDFLEVKRALKKSKFAFCKDNSSGFPVREESFVF